MRLGKGLEFNHNECNDYQHLQQKIQQSPLRQFLAKVESQEGGKATIQQIHDRNPSQIRPPILLEPAIIPKRIDCKQAGQAGKAIENLVGHSEDGLEAGQCYAQEDGGEERAQAVEEEEVFGGGASFIHISSI